MTGLAAHFGQRLGPGFSLAGTSIRLRVSAASVLPQCMRQVLLRPYGTPVTSESLCQTPLARPQATGALFFQRFLGFAMIAVLPRFAGLGVKVQCVAPELFVVDRVQHLLDRVCSNCFADNSTSVASVAAHVL